MAQKRRVYRVGEKVREIVSQELLQATDPRLQLLSITSVAVSKDLGIARVYWVPIGGEERRVDAEEALKGAAGYIRTRIAKALGTRFVPELRFFYDDTYDTNQEVQRLMERVENENSKDDK